MVQTLNKPTTRVCRVVYAGCLAYQEAWELQRTLVSARSAGQCDDTLLLLEHPPTITLGRKANLHNVLVNTAELASRGVDLVESDRGGDVTYHAPGQLVGYPILKLSGYGGGFRRYMRTLEELLIQVLARCQIHANRVDGLTGVWTTQANEPAPTFYDAKIAAIGVRLSASGVTSHGFALNVAPDLRGFDQIIPCGIQNRRVTSMEQLLGQAPPLAEVADRVVALFQTLFAVDLEVIEWQTLFR